VGAASLPLPFEGVFDFEFLTSWAFAFGQGLFFAAIVDQEFMVCYHQAKVGEEGSQSQIGMNKLLPLEFLISRFQAFTP